MVRPYRYIYDGIIVHYMVREQFIHQRLQEDHHALEVPVAKRTPSYVPVKKSFTELYRLIQNSGYPKVSKKTVQKHLNEMVNNHDLVIHSKNRGQYNKTLYRLDIQKLVTYFGYLLTMLTRLVVHHREKYTPYPDYLIMKLFQFSFDLGTNYKRLS
jgi:hypothetical protein